MVVTEVQCTLEFARPPTAPKRKHTGMSASSCVKRKRPSSDMSTQNGSFHLREVCVFFRQMTPGGTVYPTNSAKLSDLLRNGADWSTL